MNENERLSTSDIASASNRDIEERPEDMASQHQDQSGATATAHDQQTTSSSAPLFDPGDAQALRQHWSDVQAAFVDDPRQAVQRADELVAEVIKRLADNFAEERSKMEQQWSSGQNVSTDDLRLALQRYRSFFDRLLSF